MINNILQYLEESARRFPDKIALQDEKNRISYREYLETAERIGSGIIRKLGGLRNRPVVVLVDRSLKTICSFMGVVYSGNFYVPIDADMPEERIKNMFHTLDPALVIDARSDDDTQKNAVTFDSLSTSRPDPEALAYVGSLANDTNPLYAVFTSGSTGSPKCVVKSHRSVIEMTRIFEETFHFSDEAVFGNQAPFDFDLSAKDIYTAMQAGATLDVIQTRLFRLPGLLTDHLKERKINTLLWSVSAMRIVAELKSFDGTEAPNIDNVMFSGEIIPAKSLNYWMDHIPGARYVNLYGPTETAYNCTYYEVKQRLEPGGLLPVGKPFVNCRVFLRDAENNVITKAGETGEICTAGPCLAMGYWNDPERTREVFVPDFAPDFALPAYPSLIYTTGDMGYYDAENNLVFTSRKDDQIKHMGYRIELGEVEAALNTIPFLVISCCVYDRSREKIVCFYQAEEECRKKIIMELSKKIPKYMWPNKFIYMETMPLNRTGKIDRAMLKKRLQEDGK